MNYWGLCGLWSWFRVSHWTWRCFQRQWITHWCRCRCLLLNRRYFVSRRCVGDWCRFRQGVGRSWFRCSTVNRRRTYRFVCYRCIGDWRRCWRPVSRLGCRRCVACDRLGRLWHVAADWFWCRDSFLHWRSVNGTWRSITYRWRRRFRHWWPVSVGRFGGFLSRRSITGNRGRCCVVVGMDNLVPFTFSFTPSAPRSPS